ncbi:sigma-70 family RNA polymerase sigma factor [Tundrisphaera sp. TA3]|uniref:sigma-70 family RNA polymerase sigma factor n=1 Tax=Tundrisphaera sp. TA3 TaxID=3435775 RepID=UPI003EBF6DB9
MASAGLGSADRHLRDLFGAGTAVGQGDGQLLARYASSRDGVAFEALVARHGPLVLATCRAILRDEHDVEDAFQATFLVLARRAGAIRGGEALAAWLHRVAYRASLQLAAEAGRRRRKEAEAAAMKPPIASVSGDGSDPELRRVVHEEVDRLPEGQRLPVVLCDLEGLSYEQAAGRLRWTVPTLRNRLARARQRLKGRLARRGLAAPAVAALLATPATASAVPPALARAAVSAATGGGASAVALALTHAITRGMLMTKIKIAATSAVAAFGLATAGVIAAGAGRPEGPDARPDAPARSTAEAAATEQEKPVETVEVRGRVVAPDGRPVAGAVVRAALVDRGEKPWPEATSGADGRFAILLTKPGGAEPQGYAASFPWLVASAPGFGVGWIERALRANRPAEQVVSLVEEGPPIEGRIIDLEGRPAADARVEVARIWFEARGDLPGWIARARNGAAGNLWQGLENLPMERPGPIAAEAGPDGRFRLTGVGRDRIAELNITGPGLATTRVNVLSREEATIRSVDKAMLRQGPFIVEAPRFQIALAPSKRIEGVARDKDSGKPIAGLKIKAAVYDASSMIPAQGIEARTDAEGRYRLEGLPRSTAYRLFLEPGPGLPYTRDTLKVTADSPALEPVAFDFAPKAGIVVRGKVTDKGTGRPVRGYASYYTFRDNPHLADYPRFSAGLESYGQLGADGSYELTALPGRGLIAIRAEEERHLKAVGAETIAGFNPKTRWFDTAPNVCHVDGFHAIAEVNLGPDSVPATVDFHPDPGRSAEVRLVDPEGRPVGETTVKGLGELFATSPSDQQASRFEVHALDPSKPRRVVAAREGRKLIGSALLRGDEAGPVTIQLQPWGTVVGRIVDDEGKPRKGMFIGSPTGSTNPHPETDDILPGSDWNQGIWVGDDGRFRVERLVPGLRYNADARANMDSPGDLFVNLIVAPGEVKDLGDLKVQPPKKQED